MRQLLHSADSSAPEPGAARRLTSICGPVEIEGRLLLHLRRLDFESDTVGIPLVALHGVDVVVHNRVVSVAVDGWVDAEVEEVL